MAARYDVTSETLFGLYNTWQNGAHASALCIHSLHLLSLEDCKGEVVERKDSLSAESTLVYMVTRPHPLGKRPYFLQSFAMEKIAGSNSIVFYFVSSLGSLSKVLLDSSTFEVNLISETYPISQSQLALTQIELVNQNLFIASDTFVHVVPKHACGFYKCR